MPYIPIPDPCFNTPTPSPLRRYLCHWFWHLEYVSNVCILAFLIRNRLSRIILAFVVSLLIFRIVPMLKLLNTFHRASVRLFMWHVYFRLSFSLFHWYSNCPLHHTSCLFKVSSFGVTQFTQFTQFNRFSQFTQFTRFAQFTQFMFYFLFLVIYCCFPNNMLLLSSSIDVCPISPNVGWRVIRAPTDTFLVFSNLCLFLWFLWFVHLSLSLSLSLSLFHFFNLFIYWTIYLSIQFALFLLTTISLVLSFPTFPSLILLSFSSLLL